MLELRDVTRLYGGRPGVDGVSFSAPAGARTVIVGASGSGKTTLLRLIAGFEAPDRGTITLAGRNVAGPTELVPSHKRNIAYVPQEGALFPHMSVAGNIGFALPRRAGDRAGRIDDLLTRVGLSPDMRDRRPHQLSGGQQQRVALARALAQRPALMLLDEPFSALDTGLRAAMRAVVGAVLAQSGITAVLVTHDQSEALAFADHLVVMREGAIADAGPPQRVYDQPADAHTAAFLGDAILLPAEMVNGIAMTGLGPVPVHDTGLTRGTLLLRPAQIEPVAPENHDAGNRLGARVRQRTFCGTHWQVEVALEAHGLLSEPPILATLPFPPHAPPSLDAVVPVRLRGTAHMLA